jgi:hypothetical protein
MRVFVIERSYENVYPEYIFPTLEDARAFMAEDPYMAESGSVILEMDIHPEGATTVARHDDTMPRRA